MTDSEEQILVVPRSVFDRLGAFQGVCLDVNRWLPVLLSPENNLFLPRSQAEPDPSFKQIIPYCIVTHRGKILRYFRGQASGEARLHAKASIGIGGHINNMDTNGGHADFETYGRAVARELREELHTNSDFPHHALGLLNDDSNDVGKVHLGVIHHCRLNESTVRAGEVAIEGLEWLTLDQIRQEVDRLETWSRLVVENWASLFADCADC